MRALALFIVLMVALLAAPVYAQNRCALSLVLAIDVSSSVDDNEYKLQMQGLGSALRDPEVMQAIVERSGIQLSAFEWSGRRQHVDILPWAFIANEAEIFAASDIIAKHARGFKDRPTALGFALGYASIQLQKAPLNCLRQIVDVSGDGINNDGFEPHLAYKNFPYGNVQVNGLVITGARPDPVRYFQQHVIHGPGAFVEIATGFDDYERAMKRKLLREINGAILSQVN